MLVSLDGFAFALVEVCLRVNHPVVGRFRTLTNHNLALFTCSLMLVLELSFQLLTTVGSSTWQQILVKQELRVETRLWSFGLHSDSALAAYLFFRSHLLAKLPLVCVLKCAIVMLPLTLTNQTGGPGNS